MLQKACLHQLRNVYSERDKEKKMKRGARYLISKRKCALLIFEKKNISVPLIQNFGMLASLLFFFFSVSNFVRIFLQLDLINCLLSEGVLCNGIAKVPTCIF